MNNDALMAINTGIGGIAAAANVVGQVAAAQRTASGTRENMRLANQLNRENAEWQNQVNIANWHMQNEYNSPVNQRKRLEEAGLNPNLMYGNGTASAGNAGDVGSAQHGTVSAQRGADFGNMGMSAAAQTLMATMNYAKSYELTQSQIEVQKAQQAQLFQDIVNKQSDQKLKEIGYLRELFQYDVDKDLRDYYISSALQSLENLRATGDNILARTNESYARAANLDQDSAVKVAQIEEIGSRLHLNEVQAMALQQGIQESAQRIAESQARVEGINLDNKYKDRTMDDRVKTVEQCLLDATWRSENGRINFDRNSFENAYQKKFGHKPGANIMQAAVGYFERWIRTKSGVPYETSTEWRYDE